MTLTVSLVFLWCSTVTGLHNLFIRNDDFAWMFECKYKNNLRVYTQLSILWQLHVKQDHYLLIFNIL